MQRKKIAESIKIDSISSSIKSIKFPLFTPARRACSSHCANRVPGNRAEQETPPRPFSISHSLSVWMSVWPTGLGSVEQ